MTIKLGNAVSLMELINTKLSDKIFPIKTAYKINKIVLNIEKDLDFFKTKYNELYAKYDDDGKIVNVESFNNELQELLNLDIEVEDIYFSFEELDSLQLTVSEINILFNFIK